MIDATHDPRRQSWVESANGHPDFPMQNLPFVIFSAHGGKRRGGVVIGEEIVELAPNTEALRQWKGPEHLQTAIERVRVFLDKHTPR